MAALKRPLKCLTKITEEMEAISDLNRVRRTSSRATDILWATVTSNDLDTRMLLEPGFEDCGTPLGQQIDWTTLFQIEQNGAIPLAFAERKIINAQHARRHNRRRWQLSNQPQERVTAGWQVEALARTCTSCATKRQAQLLQRLAQAHGALGMRQEKIGQTFSKCYGRTGGIGTTEAAHMQNRPYKIRTDGQIVRRSGVIAMNTRGGLATAWASSAQSGGLECDRDAIRQCLHIKKLKSYE
jgi:hypothetical protein